MSSDDVNSPEDGSSEKEEKDKKSLVFLTPLCETLVKLKEVIDETADADGIEVFEVEELEEMRHLLPSLGQCLMIASNPRKCAQALLMNKRAIKILQTKSILLSAKKIPNKTLDKFVKVGLTECIVEPVAPKTLLYKVRLLLRSIAN